MSDITPLQGKPIQSAPPCDELQVSEEKSQLGMQKLTWRRLVIRAGRTERHYWRDLWRYRELFYFLAWRDILVRYKQTGNRDSMGAHSAVSDDACLHVHFQSCR